MSGQTSGFTELHISGVPRGGSHALPVSGGIPFPPGVLSTPRRLRVTGQSGKTVPSQAETLVAWDDGSVKVALITVLSCDPKQKLSLRWEGSAAASRDHPQLKIKRSKQGKARRIEIDTGAARFVFAADPTPVLKQIHRGGKPVLAKPLGLPLQALSFTWYDAIGPGKMKIESSGPLRAVVRLSGEYRSVRRGQPGLKWIVRIEMWAGSPHARIFHTLVDDDPRSLVRLRNFGVSLRLKRPASACAFGGEAGTGKVHRGKFGGGSTGAEHYIYQAGQRGGCDGVGVETAYRGVGNGRHAAGWAQVGDVALHVRHFWQQFPKELAARADGIDAWLHTDRRGEYFWSEAPGIAKTHEMILCAGEADPRKLFATFEAGPLLAASPAWYLSCGVYPFLAERDARSRTFDALVDKNFETYRWPGIGWKSFGDKRSGRGAGPEASAYFNNHHYEEPRTQLFQFLRTGEHRWFEQGVIGARHFMDVDVQHSPGPNRYADGSNASPNPGPGFVWMHYSHDHQGVGHVSHFHLGGLSQYYLLTGDRRALEVLTEVADHTASLVEDPPPTFDGETLSQGMHNRTGPQVKTGYWGQTRDLGWIVHLMHQAYQATGNLRYPRAAEIVIRKLIRLWRTPTTHLQRSRKVGVHKPPNGCWPFHWHAGDKVCNGVQNWGTAIVLMSVVEFFRDNERLRLVPRKTLLDMMHQIARYMAKHMWVKEEKAFRYKELEAVRPNRYWPNSLYLFPLAAIGRLTGDEELLRICRETYEGPLGVESCARTSQFNLGIGMWLTPNYLGAVAGR